MPEKNLSRRKFLTALGVLGAGTVVCGGLGYLGLHSPALDFPALECGVEGGPKMLVAYSSKAGSTGGVAKAIAERLCEKGARVTLLQANDVSSVKEYEAVVVGSAVYMSRVMGEMADFLERFRSDLQGKALSYFAVCLTMKEDTPEKRTTASTFLQPAREILQPANEGLFAGALDYEKLSFIYRTIIKGMGEEEGDFRDWAAIASWADLL